MNVAKNPKPVILIHVFIDLSFLISYAEVAPRLIRLGVDCA